jgi:hypothetical protein
VHDAQLHALAALTLELSETSMLLVGPHKKKKNSVA